jgi:hypothetical protein
MALLNLGLFIYFDENTLTWAGVCGVDYKTV